MEGFAEKNGGVIIIELTEAIRKCKDYLSEIDGAIGDGDHGVNMYKGFTLCKERLDGKKVGFAEAAEELGNILLMEIGGSMGPLYGTFFLEMGACAKQYDVISAQNYSEIMKAGLTGIRTLVTSDVGDKTLLDVLIPSVSAAQKAIQDGKNFDDMLAIVKKAAEDGKNSTKDMVAKVGRASRLGERSRGYLDAGATSCCIILTSMADSVQKIIRD